MQVPKHLSKESQVIYKRMTVMYQFDCDGLLLLKVALENYDRMQLCRKEVADNGVLVMSPTTKVKHMNPAITAEKIATSNFLQSWRLLGCGEEPEEIKGLIMKGR